MSDKVRSALERMMKKVHPMQAFAGKVTAVNVDNYTCDVESADGGAIFHDVRLKASVDSDDNGIVTIPEVNSYVLVSTIGNNQDYAYVSIFSKVKSYLIKCSNGVKIEIKDDGEVHLNGDGLGGLVKVAELKTQLDKNTQLLEAIQNVFSSWTPVPNDGGAALKAVSTSFTSLPVADLSNIENEKVKHGG